MRRACALFGLVVCCASGCAPEVGSRATCDEALAETVVYRLDGRPAYVGQALLIQSCGTEGLVCHAEGAPNRVGVPFGLDFAAFPLTSDSLDDLARLARAQNTIHRYRNVIWRDVLDGTMPPGPAGAEHQARPEHRYYVSVEEPPIPMPGLETAEAREALRNWLACGSPVVERFAPPEDPIECTVDAHCPVSNECDITVDECIGIGDVVPALEVAYTADFPSIWQRILRPSCADVDTRCHGEDPSAELDLSTMEGALADLLEEAAPTSDATGAECGGRGLRRVVPGDPESSLLYRKVVGRSECGAEMPIGQVLTEAQTDAIFEWIASLPPE